MGVQIYLPNSQSMRRDSEAAAELICDWSMSFDHAFRCSVRARFARGRAPPRHIWLAIYHLMVSSAKPSEADKLQMSTSHSLEW